MNTFNIDRFPDYTDWTMKIAIQIYLVVVFTESQGKFLHRVPELNSFFIVINS